MTTVLLHPDFIGTALLCAAVALAMSLFAAPRVGRRLEDFRLDIRGSSVLAQRFAFSFARMVTLWAGMLAGLAVLAAWGWKIDYFWEHGGLIEQMLVGGAVATAVGLVHDAFRLKRHQFIAGQCLIALLLTSGGLVVRQISHPEWDLNLGVVGIPATMLWLVLMMNAAALWRVPSGWLVVEGLLVLATVLTYAISQQYSSVALWCCLVGGSLAGLLVFHAPRWSASLGATGTLWISVQLCVLAIHAASSGPREIPVTAALYLTAIPLVLFLLRLATNRFGGDGQPSVPLRSTRQRVAQLDTAPVSKRPSAPSLRTTAAVKPRPVELAPHQSGILRVSGHRDWHLLWETLCALGIHLDLSEFELQIDIASLNEAWHGRKRRYKHRDKDDPIWRMELPLYVGERHVGRLLLAGMSRRESHSQWVSRVTRGLRPFEIHLLAMMESHAHLPAELRAPPPLEQRMAPLSDVEAASANFAGR